MFFGKRFSDAAGIRLGLSVMTLAIATFSVSPAKAGFEWTPPPPRAAEPPPKAMPVPAIDREPLVNTPAPVIDPFPVGEPMAPSGMIAETPAPFIEATPAPPPVDGMMPIPMTGESMPPPPAVPAINATPLPNLPTADMILSDMPSDRPSAAQDPVLGLPGRTVPALPSGLPAGLPPAPAAMMAPVAPAPPMTKVSYETVMGFGRDIPLVLALHQIVPAGYAYSFDDGVNKGARLSWNGGKAWNEVLEDALRPLDLRPMISGKTVRIRQSWESGPSMTPAPAPESVMARRSVPRTPESMPTPLMAEPMNDVAQDIAMAPPAPLVPASSVPMMATAMASPQINAETLAPQPSYPARRRPPMPGMPEPVVPPRAVADMPAVNDMAAPIALTATAAPAPRAPTPAPGLAPVPHTMIAAAAVPPAPLPAAPVMHGGAMDPMEILYWQAADGENLKNVLERWAAQSRVTLVWNSVYDYVLPNRIRMHGTFPDAVQTLLDGFSATDPRPVGKLHPNLPAGPSVLMIESYSAATN